MQIIEHPILDKKFNEEVTFYFNNQPFKAKKGQTVAAALMANSIRKLGASRKFNKARGIFCANGRCTSCFVTINELEHVLSCATLVEEGMRVSSNESDPDVRGESNGN